MDKRMEQKRVVITGMGIVCGIGNDKQEVLNNIERCRCGIDQIKSFDVSCYDCRYGSEVKNYDPNDHFSGQVLEQANRCSQFALLAVKEALQDAKMDFSSLPDRKTIGICVGSSHSALDVIHRYYRILYGKGDEAELTRSFLFRKLHSSVVKLIASQYRINGLFSMPSTACASGNNALGMAADWIWSGRAKYVIAGATDVLDMSLHAGFWGLNAVSPNPCSPFSGTPGISLGEGAAFFVLEDIATARERNAPIYAEFLGYGLSGDAHHATSPDPMGKGVVLALERAVEDAGISRDEIQYVNAHGTGTHGNDEMESRAHLAFFGDRAAQVPLSSTKSYFGHATGAAGALEVCVSILCMNRGILPPTLNFTKPRYHFGLDHLPNEVRHRRIDVFLSNSFGFAGNNAVVAIGQYKEERKTPPHVNEDTRVVITGIGLVSPLATGVEEFRNALWDKKTGVSPIERFDTNECKSRYGCLLENFDPREYDRQVDERRMDLISQFGCVAASLCLADAQIPRKKKETRDIGIVMCVSSAPRQGIDRHLEKLIQEGPDRPSSIYFPYSTQNSSLGHISIHLGLQGFTSNLHVDGCSGLNGMMYGYMAIKAQRQRKIMVGGGDEVHWSYFRELSLLGELSKTERMVPFGANSKGFLPGEGAIFLLMESLESAKERNAKIYAEMVGCGMNIDSNPEVVENEPSGKNLISAMERAMREGNVSPERIGIVSCTERGIPSIREAEEKALTHFFAGQMDKISLVNTVPYTGWMDAVSPLFNLVAMHHSFANRELLLDLQDESISSSIAPALKRKRIEDDRPFWLCLGVGREGYNYAVLLKPYNGSTTRD